MPPAPRRKVFYKNQHATGVINSSYQSLLFVRLPRVVDDGEVAQLVRVLVAGDDVEVVSQLLLLQVLLGEVLEVALGERRLSCHGDTRLNQRGVRHVRRRFVVSEQRFHNVIDAEVATRSAVITVTLSSNVLLENSSIQSLHTDVAKPTRKKAVKQQ